MPVEFNGWNLQDLENAIKAFEDGTVLEVAGEAVRNEVVAWLDHLEETHPNKMGWPRQHFFKTESEGTTLTIEKDAAIITIPDPYSVHVLGAHIVPKNAKYLTIPANERAYGKRAADFDSLRFVPFFSGSKALVDKSTKEVMFWLKTSVDVPAMPDALPPVDDMANAASDAIEKWWTDQFKL